MLRGRLAYICISGYWATLRYCGYLYAHSRPCRSPLLSAWGTQRLPRVETCKMLAERLTWGWLRVTLSVKADRARGSHIALPLMSPWWSIVFNSFQLCFCHCQYICRAYRVRLDAYQLPLPPEKVEFSFCPFLEDDMNSTKRVGFVEDSSACQMSKVTS